MGAGSSCALYGLVMVAVLSRSIRAGVLRVGKPLLWERARPHLCLVRTSGIEQFMNHYLRSRDVETPLFLWGDELEYGIFRFDKERNRFDLSLLGKEIRDNLAEREKGLTGLPSGCEWQPEYGSWMVEAVPRDPYRGYVSDLLLVEKNMQLRRKRLHSALQSCEIAPSSSNFPMLGVAGYDHSEDCGGEIANSRYVSDRLINPHPRFGALTRNIRSRRQSNVNIIVPKAKETSKLLAGSVSEAKSSEIGVGVNNDSQIADAPGSECDSTDIVHMDAMAFGMGCCCLQVTMQARSDHESRFLHDQLAVLAPHLLALSASTPILKGQLVDTDTRWSVISMSVDDRTDAERGVQPSSSSTATADTAGTVAAVAPVPDPQLVGNGMRRLSKSRYSSVSLFVGKPSSEEESKNLEALNDVKPEFDEDAYRYLVDGGVDPSLALHISHLFVRDPLVIFEDLIEIDNNKNADHFENIQSTNWRTIRWKPPCLEMGLEAERRKQEKEAAAAASREKSSTGWPVSPSTSAASVSAAGGHREKDIQSFGPGWRIEFRPLEVQLTDFENAAFAMLVVLTTRCILAMGYNFYLPMSLVEENMRRAESQDAARRQKFWVRKDAFQMTKGPLGKDGLPASLIPSLDEISPIELTMDEFINGQKLSAIDEAAGRSAEELQLFPGLIPAIYGYLQALGCDVLTIGRLKPYLTLLQRRASGELPTAAQWIRDYVRTHPLYRGDGVVTPPIADDLLMICDDIGMGRVQVPDLLGDVLIEQLYVEETTEPYLLSSIPSEPKEALLCTDDLSLVRERALQRAAEVSNGLGNVDTVDGFDLLAQPEPAFEGIIPPPSPSSSSSAANIATAAASGTLKNKKGVVRVRGGGIKDVVCDGCEPYNPISVCRSNSGEVTTAVPWIAHVLKGSGSSPDTYLDSSSLLS